jgi:ABC-type multidrug transport system ATPase subunit
LKTIEQKHDESLWDYVKHFYNARNVILYIQNIKAINAFCDRVSDIKTVEEITMKKPKTVADLLTVMDVYVEASEARARLLKSHNKGPSKKKNQEDQEVNTIDHGDRDHHRNLQQQPC